MKNFFITLGALFLFLTAVSAQTVVTSQVFYLNHYGGKDYGPFVYQKGQQVGQGNSWYEMANIAENSFSLNSTKDNKTFGPFKFIHNTEITIGDTSFTLERRGTYISGSIKYKNFDLRHSPIYLIQETEESMLQFELLKLTHKAYLAKYKAETAPKPLIGPKISRDGRPAQQKYSEMSENDKARYKKKFINVMKPEFDKYFKEHAYKTFYANKTGAFSYANLEEGSCLVACVGQARNPAKTGGLYIPVIWWFRVNLAEGKAIRLYFKEENAVNWLSFFGDILI